MVAARDRGVLGVGYARPRRQAQGGGVTVRPERVLALRAKGLSSRAIAAETGVSAMTIQRIMDAA